MVKDLLRHRPKSAALLSHLVRDMQRDGDGPKLTTHSITRLLEGRRAPTPPEQLDNLVRFLGDTLEAPGTSLHLAPSQHRAVVGALSDDNFHWLLSHAVRSGYLEGMLHTGGGELTLTFQGWLEYGVLKQGRSDSRRAFMAMRFGDAALDRVYAECFKPSVRAAGFDLTRLDDRPPAGSIDDRLRVEIRKARFLIADLTDGNLGAYWEAGYAEGLGRPVVYTCEAAYFSEKGTHFDTSHHHTVLWSLEDLPSAGQRLRDTIRATLPHEAVLEDDAR